MHWLDSHKVAFDYELIDIDNTQQKTDFVINGLNPPFQAPIMRVGGSLWYSCSEMFNGGIEPDMASLDTKKLARIFQVD